MKSFLVIILCLTITKSIDPASRIRWGEDANVEKYPYIAVLFHQSTKSVVILKIKWAYSCTCSILKPMWTLTAAHCIKNIKKRYYFVGYGTKYTTENYSTSNVIETKSHPSYNELKNDIALLKTEPIILNQYGKVSAVDYTTLIGHAILAFGYGLMQDGEKFSIPLILDKPLQVADLVIKKCEPGFKKQFPGLCLSPKCGEVSVTCPGDSGGPLIHSSGIVAITCCGRPLYCDKYFIPHEGEKLTKSGVVTPISPYVDWISTVIKK